MSICPGIKILTDLGELTIRPYDEKDISAHADYLYDSPKDFLGEIGFDPTKFIPRENWETNTRARIQILRERGDSAKGVVGELHGQTISLVALDRRAADGVPRIHFHIFQPRFRGVGLGAQIIRPSVELLSGLHKINRFFCEPCASNKSINALIKKFEVKHTKDYVAPAGPFTREAVVSQYEIVIR